MTLLSYTSLKRSRVPAHDSTASFRRDAGQEEVRCPVEGCRQRTLHPAAYTGGQVLVWRAGMPESLPGVLAQGDNRRRAVG